MKETDLGEKVISWLERNGWEVYQEVQFRGYGNVADIVAVRNKPGGPDDKIMWIIELKKSLSLKVMEQADRWWVHYRSVAVPYTVRSSRQFSYRVAKHFKIGVIEVSEFWDDPEVPVVRQLFELPRGNVDSWVKDELLPCLLKEHKDFSKAGSAGGGHFTPYKRTMVDVRKYIEENPGCLVREIVAAIGPGHYAHDQSAKINIGKALRWWETDWCYVHEIYRGNRFYSK